MAVTTSNLWNYSYKRNCVCTLVIRRVTICNTSVLMWAHGYQLPKLFHGRWKHDNWHFRGVQGGRRKISPWIDSLCFDSNRMTQGGSGKLWRKTSGTKTKERLFRCLSFCFPFPTPLLVTDVQTQLAKILFGCKWFDDPSWSIFHLAANEGGTWESPFLKSHSEFCEEWIATTK